MLNLLYASKETSVQLLAMGFFMLLVGRYWKAVCTKKAAQASPDEPPEDAFASSRKGSETRAEIDRSRAPDNYAARSAQRKSNPPPAVEIRLARRNLPPVPSM